MGNTSDRVSADRHGAKAHRSDSGSSHKDQEHSNKLVDSTDDPNIFNTHGSESKVIHENVFFTLHYSYHLFMPSMMNEYFIVQFKTQSIKMCIVKGWWR